MSQMILYHGSSTYFDRPDPAYSGEGMAHSDYGWGFNTGTDGNVSAEYGGAHTDGVMFSYRVDEQWINQSMLIGDQPIGSEKYQRILDALSEIEGGEKYASQISSTTTGRDIGEILRHTQLDFHTRAGAEKLADHGVKGFWSKGNDSIVFFDFDDVPESRIHQIRGDMPEARAVKAKQDLSDVKDALEMRSPEFREAFEKFLEKSGVDLDTATSIKDLPHGFHLSSALNPEYPSRSYLERAIYDSSDPEIRELLAEMHNAFDPDKPPISITNVPENQIDDLTLRQRVEYGYYNDRTGLNLDTLKAVYATEDAELIEAVEDYANALKENPDITKGMSMSDDLNKALGASYFSKPETPDEMGDAIGSVRYGYTSVSKRDPETQRLIKNIKEAMIDYGESSLGIPSEARLAAAEAEALANARNNPAELINQGNYMSSEFKNAYWSVQDAGNEALQESFREFASVLLSDEYNRRGLSEFESHGRHIDNGFTLRDGMGHAISRIINDGGLDDDYFGGRATWIRQKEQLLDIAGDDPKLVQKLEAFEAELFDHIERTHVVRPSIPEIRNPHIPTGVADEAAQVVSEGVQAASKAARAARLGSNIPAVGGGIGIGGAVLTGHAHAGQRDFAEDLHAQGILDDEALAAYKDLNIVTEATFYADTTASTIDPTGLSLIATVGAELKARADFKDWANEHAPNLTEDQFQTLSMSLFSGSSSKTEMLLSAAKNLPINTDDVPEDLHSVIEAQNAYTLSVSAYAEESKRLMIGGASPGFNNTNSSAIVSLKEAVDSAQNEVLNNMEALMSDPENVRIFLDQIPVSERLEYVRALAASEEDFEKFAAQNPEIASYIKAYDESWTGMFLAEDDALYENPELLNDYIIARSGIEEANNTSEPIVNDIPKGPFDGIAGDRSILEEAQMAGVNFDPALILQDQSMQATATNNIGFSHPQV